MNSRRALFEVVRIRAGIPAEGVPPGAIGTVVDIHESPELAYEVEVVDSEGRTIFLGAVAPHDLEAT